MLCYTSNDPYMHRDQLLLRLVATMNNGEKQAFSLLASIQKPKPEYQILFERLSRQLRKKGWGNYEMPRQLAGIGNLSRAKKKLYEQLMKCFRTRYGTFFKPFELEEKILDAVLLKKKGLAVQSEKLLQQVKVEAQHFGCHHQHFRILNQQYKFIINSQKKGMLAQLQSLREEKQRVLDYINMEEEFEFLRYRAMLFFRRDNNLRKEEVAMEVEQLLQQLLQKASLATTFMAQISRLEALATLYQLKAEMDNALRQHRKLLAIWEQTEHQHFVQAYPNRYKLHVYNYLNALVKVRAFNEFDEGVQKLRQFETHFLEEEVEDFQNIEFLQFLKLINTGQFAEAREHVKAIEQPLFSYRQQMERMVESRMITWMYNIGIFFFITEDFAAAENWFLAVVNQRQSKEQRIDLVHLSHIFLLFVYFEKQQWDQWERLKESSKKYLRRQDAFFAFEKLVLRYLQAYEGGETRAIQQATLEQLLVELEQPVHTSTIRNGLEEIKLWVRSRKDEVSMIALVSE